MEKNKRMINLKFRRKVAHGDEVEGEKGFTDIGNVQFLKLKDILFFFLELYIDVAYAHNKNWERERERVEYGKQMELAAVDLSLESPTNELNDWHVILAKTQFSNL